VTNHLIRLLHFPNILHFLCQDYYVGIVQLEVNNQIKQYSIIWFIINTLCCPNIIITFFAFEKIRNLHKNTFFHEFCPEFVQESQVIINWHRISPTCLDSKQSQRTKRPMVCLKSPSNPPSHELFIVTFSSTECVICRLLFYCIIGRTMKISQLEIASRIFSLVMYVNQIVSSYRAA
jgi:hypothetical protein